MDWEFFEKLTEAEAQLFLENFLRESGGGFRELVPELARSGLCIDYSVNSIPAVFKWLRPKLKTIPKEPDESLPEWLRQSEGYAKHLFEFDEESKVLILRVAYYLGECFNRASGCLSWSTGDRKTALQNMPVIRGFHHRLELEPIGIVEGLCSGFIAGSRSISDVSVMIGEWLSHIPK